MQDKKKGIENGLGRLCFKCIIAIAKYSIIVLNKEIAAHSTASICGTATSSGICLINWTRLTAEDRKHMVSSISFAFPLSIWMI